MRPSCTSTTTSRPTGGMAPRLSSTLVGRAGPSTLPTGPATAAATFSASASRTARSSCGATTTTLPRTRTRSHPWALSQAPSARRGGVSMFGIMECSLPTLSECHPSLFPLLLRADHPIRSGDGRADALCLERDGRITAWLNKASGLENVGQVKFSEGCKSSTLDHALRIE